jgi:hypothetical protein
VNIDRISYWARVPRQLNEDVDSICRRPFKFLRKATRQWEHEMANSPLVLAGVVQANAVLYDPDQSTWAPAVVAFTTDPRYALDGGYVQQLVQRLRECRDHRQTDPEANRFGDLLRDENSEFYRHPIPVSLTGGVDARASVTYLDPERLPGGVIPPSGLLPAIATPNDIHFLPPRLYL